MYGRDGKLDGRYIGATQLVLRDIAEVTQRLESCLDLHANEAMSGISRVSAHLHLQLHQVSLAIINHWAKLTTFSASY